MKVSNAIVQPPSLVAQLEGKANKAMSERLKEESQEALTPKKNEKEVEDDVCEIQRLIDLLA